MYEQCYHSEDLSKYSFLVTGGAGFIGSNLVEYLIKYKARRVVVLDNLSTGFKYNLAPFEDSPAFSFIEGDIRDLNTCKRACNDIDYVLHQAALGSVPRSIADPISSNEVNVSGFLNMLVAARDMNVRRFVYAASSSTYGDSESLPKIEHIIGKPLSPYAVTKFVNELYADVFGKLYGLEIIGLRYFNVFGQRQNPNGAYAAVIPLFVKQFMQHESPVINGKGDFSRDFTYIKNVVQMNLKALFSDQIEAINTVYNTAVGDRTTLNELVYYIREILVDKDPLISKVEVRYGDGRKGDIPHSLANIDKAKRLLGYEPTHPLKKGLMEAIDWYWNNLK